ncbi:MAG TPA: formate--tetrahydrofolate ligase [Candidatus Acidoferrum sp.]|nr:formate--tetrahydrofolate ligase [Candidatus Acidoferrum sp.]
MPTDVEIARAAVLRPIAEVAGELGLREDEYDCYGKYKAKIGDAAFARLANVKDGKLILVTAVNPTPAGEGKTTVSVGLGQALGKLGKKGVIALREPSLGPVFGVKGGAAGGGYAQAVPMEELNLHFTGDIHAVTAANNLLCAAIDNHIFQGNALNIAPETVSFGRCMDMNDRALREVMLGSGRRETFSITAASEVMAVLCLSGDLADLKKRLGDILIGFDTAGGPVYARDLKVEGAMAALLKDAINPNLIQTLENTPCLIHGGPFANIAHGCNSIRATKLAMKLGDYVVTEAGFGADLGAEKFLDIVCRKAGLRPDAIVLVVTVRALKYNGGAKKGDLGKEDIMTLALGSGNLEKHVANLVDFKVPVLVAINRFPTDTDAELGFLAGFCESIGAAYSIVEVFGKGGEGAVELARQLVEVVDSGIARFEPYYPDELPLAEKIEAIARGIYGAAAVEFTAKAKATLAKYETLGYGGLPVCMAKTQYSLSDDPKKLGRPTDFTVTVRDVRLSSGAGFVVALLGDIMTMPGLSAHPAYEGIDVDRRGDITGIF